jgi:hypothetical protein
MTHFACATEIPPQSACIFSALQSGLSIHTARLPQRLSSAGRARSRNCTRIDQRFALVAHVGSEHIRGVKVCPELRADGLPGCRDEHDRRRPTLHLQTSPR